MSFSIKISGSIAQVTMDNAPVNALSQASRQGLMDALVQVKEDSEVRAVVLRGKGGTFCAGADVREFSTEPTKPYLPDVLSTIENSRKPWIAAIDGFALGGGLELALACHYRLAKKEAHLGFPEVKLGLIPGAGGTVRLPRLIAAGRALEMIAEGEQISASTAMLYGLVDELVEGDLDRAALHMAELAGEHPCPQPLSSRLPAGPGNPIGFKNMKDKIRRRTRGQIAPDAAIEAVELSLRRPAEEAFKAERASFLALKSGPQSASLRHVFFAERTAGKIARAKGAKPLPLRHIGIVGGGTMGAGIATACLQAGLSVTMVERDENAFCDGLKRVDAAIGKACSIGKMSKTEADVAKEAFRGGTDYSKLGDCDLVIEAVFEDMGVKKDVFAKLDAATRSNTVLATNTSYLDVDEIAKAVNDPTRVIGLHFFSPAHVMKLLEVIVAAKASADALATGISLGHRLKKTIAAAGVCDGFIGNRIMSAYRREADYMIEDGALPHEVDEAMTDFGFPMGIFAMQDLAGLDIAWAMRKRRAVNRPANERYVEIADRLCEAERFGRKSGKGWYDYSQSKSGVTDPEVTALIEAEAERKGIKRKPLKRKEILERILMAMQKEGQQIVDEGIATSGGVIDVVMINGYGFPRWRGGPMFLAGFN